MTHQVNKVTFKQRKRELKAENKSTAILKEDQDALKRQEELWTEED